MEVLLNMKEPKEHRQRLNLHIVSFLLRMTSDEILYFLLAQITKKNRTGETSECFDLPAFRPDFENNRITVVTFVISAKPE